MRYWPEPSVTTDRCFSMTTGLAASTVTPGSTAPEVSRTTPVIEPWAATAAGNTSIADTTTTALATRVMDPPVSATLDLFLDRGGAVVPRLANLLVMLVVVAHRAHPLVAQESRV